MIEPDVLDHCRYCSLVSKANGEDPIGTADHWLIMEIPQPWPKEMFTHHPLISQLLPLLDHNL